MSRIRDAALDLAARRIPAIVVLLVALLLGFEETARIAAQFPGEEGQIFDLAQVVGPLGIVHVDAWAMWDGTDLPRPALAIAFHVVLDVAFVVLVLLLTGLAFRRWLATRDTARRVATGGVVALVVAETAEDVLLLVEAGALAAGASSPVAATALGIATSAKWLALALLVVVFARRAEVRADLGHGIRRVARALYAQRLSVVVVLLLGVLSLLPPWDALLEQVPDIERSWIDTPGGWRHGVAALVTVTLLAAVAFGIGRKRAELYWETHVLGRGGGGTRRLYARDVPVAEERRRWPGAARYAIWAAPPLLAIVVALVLLGAGRADLVDGPPLIVFVGAFTAVVVVSAGLDVLFALRPRPLGRPIAFGRERDRLFVRDVARAGDLLAVLVVAIGLLGFARSIGSLLILAVSDGSGDVGRVAGFGAIVVAGVLLAAAVVSVPPRDPLPPDTPADVAGPSPRSALRRARALLAEELDPRRVERVATPLGTVVAVVAAVVAIGMLAAVTIAPTATGAILGPVAVAAGTLGAVTTLLGLLILVLRRRRPLALFEAIGLRSDPVLAILLLIALVVPQVATTPALHAVDRRDVADLVAERDDLETEFAGWLARTADCSIVVEGRRIRPLVLLAAEGGGIRAATWTAAVVAEIADAGPCAGAAVFLSSGVSGGAVGLALAATLDDRPVPAGDEPLDHSVALPDAGYGDRLRERALELGRSPALANAVAGLLVSDPLASATGLRVPSLAESPEWRDRAALIEDAWRAASDGDLAQAWDPFPAAPTGLVVLGSTDVLSGCRVVVSQVELGEGDSGSTTTRPPEIPRCDQGTAEPALTLDLVDFFDDACPFAADWATAAMLSARFGFVTPGGAIDLPAACGETDGKQLRLVDGGYAENTGLGILADVAPRLGGLVATHNAGLAADEPPVVPYLAYLQNSPGGSLAQPRPSSLAEIGVPFAGFRADETQVSAASWIQRILAGLDGACGEDDACGAPRGLTPSDRVIIAAVGTEPSVTVPLGWGLSTTTYTQLVDDARGQAEACTRPAWSEYGCLAELLGRY